MAIGCGINDDVLLDIVVRLPLVIVVASTRVSVLIRIGGEIIVIEDSLFRRGWRLAALVFVAEEIVAAVVHRVDRIFGIGHYIDSGCENLREASRCLRSFQTACGCGWRNGCELGPKVRSNFLCRARSRLGEAGERTMGGGNSKSGSHQPQAPLKPPESIVAPVNEPNWASELV